MAQNMLYHPFLIVLLLSILCVRWLFTVPKNLQHIPKVPLLPLLWSYACGEVEANRIRGLIVPFANSKGEGAVVVYALGRWIVHILDHKIAMDMSRDIIAFPKEVPPDDLLLWKFVGKSNIILSNGESWKRHSRIVKAALNRNVPVEQFSLLGRKLFDKMGDGGLLKWDELTMRFTLDAVGNAALGHNFDAIENGNSPFVREYSEVMSAIANPLYLVFPRLERWFPRQKVLTNIDNLVRRFQSLLEHKKENAGNDMLTYMLEEPGMTDEEYRDNMVVFFIAGHDTTAGAMSSLVYYLAKYPALQQKARDEVLSAMSKSSSEEPTLETLREMPYVLACIRESLRINTPITYIVPRTCTTPITVQGVSKSYALPENTSVILNIYAIHHNEAYWPSAAEFYPERLMGKGTQEETEVDASLWLPFALGPRQCPARNFAMYELRTLAAMLLKDWTWTLPVDSPHMEGIRNGPSPFALSLPKDLEVNFTKRD